MKEYSLKLPNSEWLFFLELCIVMQMKYERKRKDKEISGKIAKRIDSIRKKIIEIRERSREDND